MTWGAKSESGSSVEDGERGRFRTATWDSDEEEDGDSSKGKCFVPEGFFVAILCLAVAIGISGLVFYYGVGDVIRMGLKMLPKNPGWWYYSAVYVGITLSIVLVLPLWPPFCMAAGLIWGLGWGMLLNCSAIFTAAVISLAIGRFCLRQPIRDYIQKGEYEKVRRMMLIVEDSEDTMQLLVLFRFLFIPMFLRNYVPSTLEVEFWRLVLACIPHTIWISFLFASIGASFTNTADLLRDTGKFSLKALKWQDVALFLVAMAIAIILAIYTHRVYSRRMEMEEGLYTEEQWSKGSRPTEETKDKSKSTEDTKSQ